ncbi:MAG: cellulose biosynthesis cyclic di-GMP-binding regulatory protein BcsB [bacterium]
MTAMRWMIAGLMLSAFANHGFGQTAPEAPLIQIAPPATIAEPEVVQPPSGQPVEAGPSPAITIDPPATATPPPADLTLPPAVPLARDASQPPADPLAIANWRLALMPADGFVPTEVRIGSSMPTPGHFRLSGEVASADFILTLPKGVPPPPTLVLALRSSANVLSQASKLTVWVNGAESGSVQLDNIGAFADKSVPITGLVTGENRIRLITAQSHRIFCGPEASFAIWTEVDLANSGVSVSPESMPTNGDSFVALASTQVMGTGAIDLLADPKTDNALLGQVANRITAAIGGAVQIKVHSFYDVQAGPDAKVRVALIPGPEPKATIRRGSGGAIVLQVEYSGSKLPDLDSMLPERSPAASVPLLTPGRATPLADLGSAEILGNTHYFRQDVNFLLPDDWLLLASQKAAFTLHYGFSADLAQGSLLLVKVNGQTIRVLPLDRDGGKVLPPLNMTFRANQLNPGMNSLTFEMSVPGDPPDLPCTPRSTDMLVILGDSSLNVPPSPRMWQSDISRSLARIGGDGIVIPPEIADPTRDEPTLLAFGALFRPLATDRVPARLHVVDVGSVGLVPRGDTGVTRQMLQTAVFPRLQTTLPQPAAASPAAYTLADDNGLPAKAAPQPVSNGGSWFGIGDLWPTNGWFAARANEIRSLAFPGTSTLAEWLSGKSGQALLLQLDPTQPDDVWLVAGPDTSMTELAQQVDLLRRARRYDLHSQALLLQRDGTWVGWSANHRPALLEPLSISNLRPVLGNYASWWPSLFATLTLAFALISVIPALIYVLITRRKGSHT